MKTILAALAITLQIQAASTDAQIPHQRPVARGE